MKNYRITKKQLSDFIANGGATLNSDGTQAKFSRGYQVGGVAAVAVVPVEKLNDALKAANALLNTCKAGELVGLWIDGDAVYIEKSEHVNRLSEAMRRGFERGEKSIYDWNLSRCIVTNE